MKKILTIALFSTVLSLFSLYGSGDSRYDANMNMPFNEKTGDVNPQTGNLTLCVTDVNLPGRAGFNFTFGRVWSLNQSNVFNAFHSNGSNRLNSNTVEKYNNMGVGWTTSIPHIQENKGDVGMAATNLFFGGNVYTLDTSHLHRKDLSNIWGYDLDDIMVHKSDAEDRVKYTDFGVKELDNLVEKFPTIDLDSNTESMYIVLLKTNEKYYFREDGKLLMAQDRSGKNRIWYFYDSSSKLTLVVDTIGREICFSYTPEGQISSIQWYVNVGKKDRNGHREIKKEEREVRFNYKKASSYGDLHGFEDSVEDYIEPYALERVINTMGHTTKYYYTMDTSSFSYVQYSQRENRNLLLTAIANLYTDDGNYLNKRHIEYEKPAGGNYRKGFYSGFYEYFKVFKDQLEDKNGNLLSPVIYMYNGHDDVLSSDKSYSTEIIMGNLTTTYTYTLGQDHVNDHLLSNKKTETIDGFFEETVYKYDVNNALEQITVKRKDENSEGLKEFYKEIFKYDKKGNLKKHVDKSSAIKNIVYDSTYSLPLEEIIKFSSAKGDSVEYKSKSTINSDGQVISSSIYLLEDETWATTTFDYDDYGNQTSVTNPDNKTIHTIYDTDYNTFPIKIYQDVTIDSWNNIDQDNYWISPRSGVETITMRSWKVFNTDGTVWIEVDNEGYAVEHYYDKAGTEVETLNPDEDDFREFGKDITNFFKDANISDFLSSRKNNPGVKVDIDYYNGFVKKTADIDVEEGLKKTTGSYEDGLGHVLKEVEYYPDGAEFSEKEMLYDQLGRMIAITDPDAIGVIEKYFDPYGKTNGNTIELTEKTWVIKYDDLGRKKAIRYPKTNSESAPEKVIEYNDSINQVTTIDPEGRKTVQEFDCAGNLIKVISYGDESEQEDKAQEYSFEYDSMNRKISFTDAKGLITKYEYNERNLLTKQIFKDNKYEYEASDIMEYNKIGQLTKKTDRKGQVIDFIYDELGRNIESSYVVGDETQSIKQTYDNRGNAIRIENHGLIEFYEYDSKNAVVKLDRHLKEAQLRETFSNIWENDEDLNSQVFRFEYKYNSAGMIKEITYPDGSIHAYGYDELSRLQNIKENRELFVSSLEYNKSGVVTQMDYANKTRQTWVFDNRKRISHIGITKLGPYNDVTSVYADLNYTLNSVGNILKINDNEYEYDAFNRVKKAKTLIPDRANHKDSRNIVRGAFGTFKGDSSYNVSADLNEDERVNGPDHALSVLDSMGTKYDVEHFEYDKNGNRKKLTQNGVEYEYHYGIRNRLEKITRTFEGEEIPRTIAEYEYDGNGNTVKRTLTNYSGNVPNLVGKESVTEFIYDTMNRLIQTKVDGSVITTNIYDNAGNRLIKKSNSETILYIRHGQIAVAMDIEVPKNTTEYTKKTNRYVLSGDLLAGRVTTTYKADETVTPERFYYHLDHLNSTKAVTNADGELDAIYEYRAFGEELKKIGEGDAKYTYGGKELDNDTNLYYFNARFYDPTIGRFINVDPIQDGTNWYVYCSNNPLSFVDPTGLVYKEPTEYLYNVYKRIDEEIENDLNNLQRHEKYFNTILSIGVTLFFRDTESIALSVASHYFTGKTGRKIENGKEAFDNIVDLFARLKHYHEAFSYGDRLVTSNYIFDKGSDTNSMIVYYTDAITKERLGTWEVTIKNDKLFQDIKKNYDECTLNYPLNIQDSVKDLFTYTNLGGYRFVADKNFIINEDKACFYKISEKQYQYIRKRTRFDEIKY